MLASQFPGVPVYPSLGNNDVFPDYHFPLNTTSDWMKRMGDLWGTELGWISEDAMSTFLPGGFYVVNELWEGGPSLIVLNTVIYSVNFSINPFPSRPTPVDELPEDPNGQFAWLEAQLIQCRERNQE